VALEALRELLMVVAEAVVLVAILAMGEPEDRTAMVQAALAVEAAAAALVSM
jgi:hypothetical protein